MEGRNLSLISLEDMINEAQNESAPKYAMWLQDGDEFIPAPHLKTAKKIKKGAYKVVWKRDDWHLVPVPINSDELFQFSEDFTTKVADEAQMFWERADIYKQHKFVHKRGMLLCGAPGCGKTAIITMLMKQLIEKDGLIFVVNNVRDFSTLTEVLSPIIRKIEPDRPIITIIEDVDQLIENMNGNDEELLDFLDGKNSIEHHLVILTSNDTTDLSDALLRPSRIDMMFEVPNPGTNIRREFFEKKGISQENLDEYTELTEDMSFAELKEVFVGTQILGKDIHKVIEQIRQPFECKDYLNKTENNEIEGI